MDVRPTITQVEPGSLLISFSEPLPPIEDRGLLLHQALKEWLAAHPEQAIKRLLPVREANALVGLRVWLGDARGDTDSRLPVKVHFELAQRLSTEHIEALLADAWRLRWDLPHQTAVALVSRGGNAAVFDQAGEQCYLLPLAEMQNLDADARQRYEAWRLQPEGEWFVIELGDFQAGR
jgi:hypothetical protein